MSPEGRNAVICSGGGAKVFLAGCCAPAKSSAAEEIRPVGGVASTAWVDAFDERRGEENISA
jgi:hypothetical protein